MQKVQGGAVRGALSDNFKYKNGLHKQGNLLETSKIEGLYAQAGISDMVIAQVKYKVPKKTMGSTSASEATTSNFAKAASGKILPKYKSLINNVMCDFNKI